MKRFYIKALVTACLMAVGGVSSWADKVPVTVLSENYESYSTGDITSTMQTNGWTFQSKNNKNVITIVQGSAGSVNESKYFDFYYPDGGASRNQRWDFGVTSSLDVDNWTLTFSAALNPGANNSANIFAVSGTSSSNVETANNEIGNLFLKLKALEQGSVVYKPTIGATEYPDEEFTLTSGTWYKFTVAASNIDTNNNTATVYVKITSYDEESKIWEKTVENLSTSAIGTLRGLVWNSPRGNSRLNLDDVVLKKEVDASVSNPPTFTYKSYSGANRTYTLTNPNGGGTLYYTTSPAAVAPEVGDAAYSSTTDLSKDVTYSSSGIYYAYVVNASDVTSEITSQAVTAVAPVVPDGTYYFKNKVTGAYFAGGLTWGTQAITNNIGHSVVLTFSPSALTYTIDTGLSNGGTNHFLTEFLWCDGAATQFGIASDGAGYYTISYGDNKLTAGASGELLSLTDGTGDATKWQVLTVAEWKAENVARLNTATASNGVDATFYIPAANFNRNDNTENAKWQGGPAIGGLDGSGVVCSYNAEKYNEKNGAETCHTFDVYQSLTGLKPGVYKLTADGYYRDGATNNKKAFLYANTSEVALQNIREAGVTAQDNDKGFTTTNGDYYVPNTQQEAAKAFANGYYSNELYFVVGEDGALRLGVKRDDGVLYDWTVFDNFQLTYYGTAVPATIGSTGYTTFASTYALDLDHLPTGVTAYYVQSTGVSVNGDYVTLTKATGTVQAGEGLILKADEAGTYNIPVATSGSALDGNKLKGCTSATDVPVNAKKYVLAANGGVAEFQNLSENAANVPAGKAYLDLSDMAAKARLIIALDGEANDIDEVEIDEEADDAPLYNVAGQIVDDEYKGIVIKNGKKYLNK